MISKNEIKNQELIL